MLSWVKIKQLFTLKTIWVSANIVFTVLLAVQLSHILQGYIKPQTTRTWEEEVPLHSMEFPLVVKVCVIPGFNQTALQEVGYKDTFAYFLGLPDSESGGSLYGWAGHTKENGTFGSVEEVLTLATGHNFENVVESVYVWVENEWEVNIPLKYLDASKVNYPHNCRSLDVSKVPQLKGKSIQNLNLYVGDLGNNTIKVQFKGRTLDSRRNIIEHSFDSIGDEVTLNEEKASKSYLVEITQRQHVENIPSNQCRIYPNEEHASYEDCDNQFVKSKLPGLTPVWMADQLEQVSTHVSDENGTCG